MKSVPGTKIETAVSAPKSQSPEGGAGSVPGTTVIRTRVVDPKDEQQLMYWFFQNVGAGAQCVIAFVAVAAVVLAGIVAWNSYQTSLHDARSAFRQAQDSQLSAAIDALGAPSTTERISGLLLLRRNAEGRFTQASQSGELPGDVYADYTTVLQILSGYLKSQSENVLTAVPYATFHRGYGTPPASDQTIDLVYAADQVQALLTARTEKEVNAVRPRGEVPSIDLSDVELYGLPWTGVNFSWVHAFMVGIDLRDADLNGSLWGGHSDLQGADLQCADLTDANFQGANLLEANLNGADVQGADFRDTQIKLPPGPIIVYGTAHWSHVPAGLTVRPVGHWNPQWCVNTYITLKKR